MKKLLLSFALITGFITAFAQDETLERKLKVKDFPVELISKADRTLSQKLNCNCDKNLIKDGGFNTVTVVPGGSNIISTSPIWKPLTATPQHSKTIGACDSGFVSMWGNKTTGESIYQSGLSLQKGKCYTIKFNARFINQTGPNNPNVQLAVLGSASAVQGNPRPLTSSAIVSTPPITNTAWASYSMSFTAASNLSSLTFFPVNGNSQNDGAFVSWIQLDNVCVQECCSCDIPKLPPITTGASPLCACDPIKFSTINCPGATYKWTVTDDKGNTVSFSGGNTNSIALNYNLAQQVAAVAAGFIVTVEISCGIEV